MSLARDSCLGVASALAVAVATYWLLRHRRRRPPASAGCGANTCQCNAPGSLCIFHCGEQEAITEQIGIDARSRGYEVAIDTLDRFEAWVSACACLARPPPCLLVVTTGEELQVTSRAAAACILFLARKNHSSATPLDRFRFAVLGLGDSNHLAASHRSIAWASGKDCNQVGELFDRWLAQLGGIRIVRRGESDERTDHAALDPWMASLWAALGGIDPVILQGGIP